MLDFEDSPYAFFPPRLNRSVLRGAQEVSRWLALPLRHQVSSFVLQGEDRLAALRKQGARVVFVPNHSTHSDPQIMMEFLRRTKWVSHTMAAYDVFQRSAATEWLMTRCGAFSIDRDGTDRASVQQAVKIILEGESALTIFPEGNVYFSGDRPMPFLEGAAFMALRAQKKLGEAHPVVLVPLSIKVSHTTDQRPAVMEKLAELARVSGGRFDRQLPPVDGMYQVARTALRTAMRSHLPEVKWIEGEELPLLLERATIYLADDLERALDLSSPTNGGGAVAERIRRIRATLHKQRLETLPEERDAALERLAERAMIALRLVSYRGDYVQEQPTLDRVAESVEKMLEDVTGRFQAPFAPRQAVVRVNDPIPLLPEMKAFSDNGRDTIRKITERCEQRVQAGLESIHSGLRTSGAREIASWQGAL